MDGFYFEDLFVDGEISDDAELLDWNSESGSSMNGDRVPRLLSKHQTSLFMMEMNTKDRIICPELEERNGVGVAREHKEIPASDTSSEKCDVIFEANGGRKITDASTCQTPQIERELLISGGFTEYDETAYCSQQDLITRIEGILTSVASALLVSSPLQFSLKIRSKSTATIFDKQSSTIRRISSNHAGIFTFPGKNATEAWRFTVLLKILELIHEALVDGIVTTKRDIYYKHPKLFKSQRIVDKLVDDIACTFGVDRGLLNVAAAAKGLIYGGIRITKMDGTVTDCKVAEGILIPSTREVASVEIEDEVQWVLVVEKEAVFRTLVTCGILPGILITGKGYPDLATREFLRLLVDSELCCRHSFAGRGIRSLPVYVVMDWDPHGLDILSTFMFGSESLAHENHRLAVKNLQWLGAKSADLKYILQQEFSDTSTSDDSVSIMMHREKCNHLSEDKVAGTQHGLLALSGRDRRMAAQMLRRDRIQFVAEWRLELQRMLFFNAKAEIEIINSLSLNGLEEWVLARIRETKNKA
ncbi:endodeoxyribonuclease [Rhizina undulata]